MRRAGRADLCRQSRLRPVRPGGGRRRRARGATSAKACARSSTPLSRVRRPTKRNTSRLRRNGELGADRVARAGVGAEAGGIDAAHRAVAEHDALARREHALRCAGNRAARRCPRARACRVAAIAPVERLQQRAPGSAARRPDLSREGVDAHRHARDEGRERGEQARLRRHASGRPRSRRAAGCATSCDERAQVRER